MSVNGVTGYTGATDPYAGYSSTAKAAESKETKSTSTAEKDGVIYEKSEASATNTKKNYKVDPNLVAKLKADSDARISQMESLVQKMMSNQGNAYGQANDIWKLLSGGKFTVDAATKAKAQKDISEDGYWGVKQTSERIVDFAKALTGGDPAKIDEMRNAFEKGFKQATKAWGKDLPSISNSTYDAVMKGFDAWKQESGVEA